MYSADPTSLWASQVKQQVSPISYRPHWRSVMAGNPILWAYVSICLMGAIVRVSFDFVVPHVHKGV